MFTLLLITSMYYNGNGDWNQVKVPNLSYQTCQSTLAKFAIEAEKHDGNKHGYVIEFSDCILQEEVVK